MSNELITTHTSAGIIPKGNASTMVAQSREMAEALASVQMAKAFPRDVVAARDRIINACTRPTLAQVACYTYARGGTEVTGPSIRLAEALAQNWGNMQFGIRELEQRNGESTCEAFAWDIETNTRQVKVFQVPHIRHTKKGDTVLTDPRDIYELIANNGARRLRACILGVIPGDVIDEAVAQCDITLKTKFEVTAERIKQMLDKFAQYGVTKEQVEVRIQRRIESMTAAQMAGLGKIYNSIKDGMSKPEDWFEKTEDKTAEDGSVKDSKPKSNDALRKAIGMKERAKAKEEPETEPEKPADGELSVEDVM